MFLENIAPPEPHENEDPYCDIWLKICAEEREHHIADKKIKDVYKKQLRGLVNTRALWAWLEDHDTWTAEGIFDIVIESRRSGYYNRIMPHCMIKDEKHKRLDMHHQFESKSEIGVNHIFIQQWNHGEDSYSGYIAIPLRNRKYFLISYAC